MLKFFRVYSVLNIISSRLHIIIVVCSIYFLWCVKYFLLHSSFLQSYYITYYMFVLWIQIFPFAVFVIYFTNFCKLAFKFTTDYMNFLLTFCAVLMHVVLCDIAIVFYLSYMVVILRLYAKPVFIFSIIYKYTHCLAIHHAGLSRLVKQSQDECLWII